MLHPQPTIMNNGLSRIRSLNFPKTPQLKGNKSSCQTQASSRRVFNRNSTNLAQSTANLLSQRQPSAYLPRLFPIDIIFKKYNLREKPASGWTKDDYENQKRFFVEQSKRHQFEIIKLARRNWLFDPNIQKGQLLRDMCRSGNFAEVQLLVRDFSIDCEAYNFSIYNREEYPLESAIDGFLLQPKEEYINIVKFLLEDPNYRKSLRWQPLYCLLHACSNNNSLAQNEEIQKLIVQLTSTTDLSTKVNLNPRRPEHLNAHILALNTHNETIIDIIQKAREQLAQLEEDKIPVNMTQDKCRKFYVPLQRMLTKWTQKDPAWTHELKRFLDTTSNKTFTKDFDVIISKYARDFGRDKDDREVMFFIRECAAGKIEDIVYTELRDSILKVVESQLSVFSIEGVAPKPPLNKTPKGNVQFAKVKQLRIVRHSMEDADNVESENNDPTSTESPAIIDKTQLNSGDFQEMKNKLQKLGLRWRLW